MSRQLHGVRHRRRGTWWSCYQDPLHQASTELSDAVKQTAASSCGLRGPHRWDACFMSQGM